MKYPQMKFCKFLSELDSEEKAKVWIWLAKFNGKEFICPKCENATYYQHRKKAEVRECKNCHFAVRLKANTLFQNLKIPLLIWLQAIFLVTQGKRGISALELQSDLSIKSYDIAWALLHKIREALRQRDETYKLHSIIELDGAIFGKRHTDNQTEVLVAVETKDWIDQKSRRKIKAGFAKVLLAKETKEAAQKFVDKEIGKNSMVNTNASPSFIHLENVDVDYQVLDSSQEVLDHWLPWVHKFISNAKSWIVGTHHDVEAKSVTSQSLFG